MDESNIYFPVSREDLLSTGGLSVDDLLPDAYIARAKDLDALLEIVEPDSHDLRRPLHRNAMKMYAFTPRSELLMYDELTPARQEAIAALLTSLQLPYYWTTKDDTGKEILLSGQEFILG